jgi:hypothetical protein
MTGGQRALCLVVRVKATALRWEAAKLALGVQAFNLLNHAPFDSSVNDVSSGQLGRIVNNVSNETKSVTGGTIGVESPAEL